MRKLTWMVVLLTLVSCGSSQKISDAARMIHLLEKKDLERCQPIDQVTGENDKGSETLAIEQAKVAAVDLNADSLYIEDSVANGENIVIKAMAYKCRR